MKHTSVHFFAPSGRTNQCIASIFCESHTTVDCAIILKGI